MKSKVLVTKLLFLAAIVIPHPGIAGQPLGAMPDLPGVSIGRANAYWIAPYVKVSEVRVGEQVTTTATWITDDGGKRTIGVVDFHPGFVTARENDQEVILGVNETWRIVPPKNPGPADYITSTPDSRTFVYQFHPEPGQIALDVYVHGKLAKTSGPFFQYEAEGVNLSNDGSAAMLIWKEAAKTTPQVMVLNSSGSLQFRADCNDPGYSPIAAPDGVGALLRPNAGENTFVWYTREGKMRSFEVSPNPRCVGWVPGTPRSLFSTNLEYRHRYHLIDWDTGKRLWDIPCPANGHALGICITSKFIIFSVAELYNGGPWRGASWLIHNNETEWIRSFYAVSIEDGKVISRWQAPFPRRLSDDDRERFVQLGKRVFYVTSREFVELSEDDIIFGKSGWKH